MKISVVTISFNQAKFLQACIDSVAAQGGDWEHIIVDPGSTDGSRELIERNRAHFSRLVLESDDGPADGLNKGFAVATGDVFYYLNADDTVLPGAFEEAVAALRRSPEVGVISGHGYVVDASGKIMREVWSDTISRHALAHGGALLIQPSTFLRSADFERAGRFNPANRSNWDGELVVDMFLSGSKFKVVDAFWSCYRIHGDSITGSQKLDARIKAWSLRRYEKVMGRPMATLGRWNVTAYKVLRQLRRPKSLLYKLRGVRVYGGGKD